jgi:putative addiction module killer protein
VVFVVHEYLDETGKSPFRAWLETLDKSTRARVQARILRFETGNLGDNKELGSGVWEARLAFGAGYRVYFGRRGRELILLCSAATRAARLAISDARRTFGRVT